ncbi:unnamed protein product [Eruca vesicaria subsp. sativa]|uniref:ENT domain-containing protein n=1 Tax=Eruca vesicaria subsp. sativa TaxID=29727 RepID=A0ABC8M1V4_ERUVS|nr:unnamed protein product [Eruca vesicaria subsp. sativa]
MRFKKGTKVEVLTKSSLPSGAWRSAEIISGNGHYYTVMYDADDSTQRVPRKSMRPEPPQKMQVVHSWSPGDVLEVFQSCSWKMAIFSKVLENGCVLVRLLGSSMNVKANKSDIRVRQSWQDNEWIMVGQGASRLSPQTSTGKLRSKGKTNECDVLSTKGPKKRTYTLVTPHNQTTQAEEEDRESIASSVGSCSMEMNGLTTLSFTPIETGHSSDTESSSCGYRSIKFKKKSGFTAKGSEAADIHRLELDAYRCSIERLHASGPIITWEQETWITNLRLRLNISNEEHLLQIRNLISDDNSSTYR